MPGHEGMELPTSRVDDVGVSFSVFYRSSYPKVVGLAYALSGSWTVAEEVAQEAFLRALARWDGQLHRPDAWVRQVAANLARSRLRRIGAEARAVARVRARRVDIRSGRDPVPSDLERFWAEVRTLPRRQALAVAYHYLEDRPVIEVAELMGCAEGTAKALLHQARARLAERLQVEEEQR